MLCKYTKGLVIRNIVKVPPGIIAAISSCLNFKLGIFKVLNCVFIAILLCKYTKGLVTENVWYYCNYIILFEVQTGYIQGFEPFLHVSKFQLRRIHDFEWQHHCLVLNYQLGHMQNHEKLELCTCAQHM